MGKSPWGTFYLKAVVILSAVLVLACPPVLAGQDQRISTVYVVGTSSIRGADMSAGRNEAIAESLVVAVTQVLNELMPPETLEGHFQVLSESILSRTDQFIAGYKMLTEATHGKTHHVMVKADVSVERLKATLKQYGIYLGRKQYPKILYCIAEKQIGDSGYRYWWSGESFRRAGAATEAIAKIAKDKGFMMVTPRLDQSIGAYPPELSIPEAVALGRQMQAEVVVVGQAVAEEAPNTLGATSRSFRGTVSARAYSVRNSREIGHTQHDAMVTGDDPGAGGRQSINNAAYLAGEELAAQIASAWFAGGGSSSAIELQVEGISGHIADFVKLRGAMGVMSGVDSIQRKEMRADTAVLLVDYQGSARAFAAALMRESFDTFSLNIAEAAGNTIRLQIVPR